MTHAAAGLAYAAATFLAFPHLLGRREVDLGWLFAWLAPACLLLAVRGAPPGRAAARAFLAGLAAHAAVLHWIYVVTVTYGHAPPAVGVVAPVLLAVYVAGFSAAFGAGAAWLARGAPARPFLLAALWTSLDHLRAFALSGFPWATLGYAQHRNPALLGLASFTGVYGLSFASVLGSAGLLALSGRVPGIAGGRRAGAAALAVVALAHAAGGLAAARTPRGEGGVPIAVLQGNIDQGVKWSPEWAERTLAIYEDLTRRAAARGARLVVWPETAVPGAPDASPELRERLGALAAATATTLVVGAVGLEPGAPGEDLRVFDSAFAVAPDGGFLGRYDKTHLVPFGEYVPLRAWLGRFVRAVATGSAGRDVSAGPAPRAVRLPLAAGTALTAGIPICYELLFPDLVRRFVGDGAGVLLAITNDAWYGRTGAPLQFLAITALRSAETGTWTARAANTGVSAFIDPRGRVQERTDVFERDLLVREVPVRPPGEEATFYVRHGDAFARACWAGLALGVGAAAWSRRRGRTGGREQ